jgi:hypothetical protein
MGGMMSVGITGGEGTSGGDPMVDNLVVVKAVLSGVVLGGVIATAAKRAIMSSE